MPDEVLYDKNAIIVSGARVHNLKNISVSIPRDRMVVITGLSGSGKSSLAFDTIYAEGQRRYVESLSSYARQFLGRMHKPEVDFIRGIPPAIAIEQRVNTRNPRSTVGTSTEIYDYLKLLYARIGQTISPVSGSIVKKESVTDITDHILSFPDGTQIVLLAPMTGNGGRSFDANLADLSQQGITRVEMEGVMYRLEEAVTKYRKGVEEKTDIVVDRIIVARDEDSVSRFSDSCQMALDLGHGVCRVKDNSAVLKSGISATGLKLTELYSRSLQSTCSVSTIPWGHALSARVTVR
jgi:excinuclease ABC subunit A